MWNTSLTELLEMWRVEAMRFLLIPALRSSSISFTLILLAIVRPPSVLSGANAPIPILQKASPKRNHYANRWVSTAYRWSRKCVIINLQDFPLDSSNMEVYGVGLLVHTRVDGWDFV